MDAVTIATAAVAQQSAMTRQAFAMEAMKQQQAMDQAAVALLANSAPPPAPAGMGQLVDVTA